MKRRLFLRGIGGAAAVSCLALDGVRSSPSDRDEVACNLCGAGVHRTDLSVIAPYDGTDTGRAASHVVLRCENGHLFTAASVSPRPSPGRSDGQR